MAEGRYTVVVTCQQCDLPVHLTLPAHIGPTTYTQGAIHAPIRLDQEKLVQAVRAHVENCGDTP